MSMNERVEGRFPTENKGIVSVGRGEKFLFEIWREVLDGGECIGCVTDRASPLHTLSVSNKYVLNFTSRCLSVHLKFICA